MPRPTRVPLMLLAVVTSLALTGCGGSVASKTDSRPVATTPGGTSPATAGSTITIASFAFSPTPLTVAAGATVSATNNDGAAHTVTSDAKDLFDTGDISQGKTVTFTAPTKAGTYTYICTEHSTMKGSLIVK